MTYTGQSLKRFEDPRLLTGQGAFLDDLTFQDMLYAAVLRSPHAHASIRAIDTAAAIRPDEAADVLDRFLASDDEEIVEAVQEALAIANDASEDGEWEDDDDAE